MTAGLKAPARRQGKEFGPRITSSFVLRVTDSSSERNLLAFPAICVRLWALRFPVEFSRLGKSSDEVFIDDLKPDGRERSGKKQSI